MNKKHYKVGEIKDILEKIYNDPISRRTVVPLFMSDSGMGKTYIIEEFMKEKGVYKPPFVLSQRMPFEVSGMALVDKETDIMKYYDFDFLLSLKDGDILFIDETYNANPNTLNAFLTFLESRIMISGKELPNIMIVAAANPQGKPPLTPQIHRRFLQYDIIFDDKSWKNFMFKKYGMPSIVSSKLCDLIKNEDFIGYNYNTPADLDKAINMIAKDISTPYEDELFPILNTLIENKLKDPVKLSETISLEPGEKISWLKLIQVSKGINIKHEVETIQPEQPLYDVILKDWLKKRTDPALGRVVGGGLIADIADVTYDKAQKMLNALPNVYIKHKVNEGEAASIKQRLEVNGATVEIKLSKN